MFEMDELLVLGEEELLGNDEVSPQALSRSGTTTGTTHAIDLMFVVRCLTLLTT